MIDEYLFIEVEPFELERLIATDDEPEEEVDDDDDESSAEFIGNHT